MRLLIAGDTHGNAEFIKDYLYPRAADLGCDAIVQVGDFGYWEHDPADTFLDQVDAAAHAFGTPFYWLRGNHDNIKHCRARYTQYTDDGFLICRDNVFHIPDGHIWTWGDRRFRAFGGARSLDKDWRLEKEAEIFRARAAREQARRDAGKPPQPVPSTAGQLWFPEEELTDAHMRAFLTIDSGPVDVILSHDKPASTRPWHLPSWTNAPDSMANQQRLQTALEAHRPRLWFHGHLHLPYVDDPSIGGGRRTTVISLGCDDRAASRFQRPADAWYLLEVIEGQPMVYLPGRLADDLAESGGKPDLPPPAADHG